MRVVIKGADFSNVSIGDVIEDLSFVFKNNEFTNCNPSAATGFNPADIYVGGSSAEAFTISENNPNRGISDFIRVIPNMTLTFTGTWSNTATVPSVVPFDASQNLLTPAKGFWTTEGRSFVIPEGVYFVKLQASSYSGGGTCTGSMP